MFIGFLAQYNVFFKIITRQAGTSGTDTTAATPMARPRGRQMMDLWDALCTLLRVYEVSIEDVSNKV